MTVEVLFNEMEQGRLTMDSEFVISENAWRKGGPGPAARRCSPSSTASVKRLGPPARHHRPVRQRRRDRRRGGHRGHGGEFRPHDDTIGPREIGLTKSDVPQRDRIQPPGPEGHGPRTRASSPSHLIETYPDCTRSSREQEFTWNKIRQQNRNPLLTLTSAPTG